jgi:uncharacterized membrane protein
MDPATLVGFWAVLFLGTHLAISSAAIRPRVVALIGEQPYRGVYSLVSFATFIPLVVVFANHKHAGAMLWNLRPFAPVRWLAWLLMLTAMVLFAASLKNPSPVTIGAPSSNTSPRGVLKITRHPGFTAFTLFGLAHMLMNGFIGDLLFFGTFPALGILGGMHQDSRKLGQIGDAYRRFMAETSFFPGVALWQGRQRWVQGDTPWLWVAVGAAVTVLIVVVHPMIFGGHPLG